jgi:hypothetical protein
MGEAKKRSEQHLIDAEGVEVLKSQLPRHWVPHEYRPDYGIDFALELFADKAPGSETYETMGEHIFIQLKSTKSVTIEPLKIYARHNVEKCVEQLDKEELVAEIDTVRIGIDDAELQTIERMGAGIPVLLIVADVVARRCYFVCLNDYIDKMLVPQKKDYLSVDTKTIHVPFANQLNDTIGKVAFRWYGKRAKLYAAFQRIRFQEMELKRVEDTAELNDLATVFAKRLLRFDFWDTTEMCPLLQYYAGALRSLVEKGEPGLLTLDPVKIREAANGNEENMGEIIAGARADEIVQLWEKLSLLGRNYEDVWREWFLPSWLGVSASYPPKQVHRKSIPEEPPAAAPSPTEA